MQLHNMRGVSCDKIAGPLLQFVMILVSLSVLLQSNKYDFYPLFDTELRSDMHTIVCYAVVSLVVIKNTYYRYNIDLIFSHVQQKVLSLFYL